MVRWAHNLVVASSPRVVFTTLFIVLPTNCIVHFFTSRPHLWGRRCPSPGWYHRHACCRRRGGSKRSPWSSWCWFWCWWFTSWLSSLTDAFLSLPLSLSLSLKICDLLFVAIVLLGSVVLVVSTNQQHNGRSGEMFLHQKTVWKCELIEHRGELRI